MRRRRYVLKSILTLLIAPLLTFCGAKKAISKGLASEEMAAKHIIKNHYDNALLFKTLSGRLKVTYNDGASTQSYTMTFRMEKDKTIWLSAPLSMAKMLITPARVSFYNKLDNTYFDGDFSYLTHLLGAELNFEKVQNMLLGQAIFNLEEEPYTISIINNSYQLIPKKETPPFKKTFFIEPLHYKIILQELTQPEQKRTLNIRYNDYQTIENKLIPQEIIIAASEGEHITQIELSYKNIEFNKELSFPYNIPDGYKQITLQ